MSFEITVNMPLICWFTWVELYLFYLSAIKLPFHLYAKAPDNPYVSIRSTQSAKILLVIGGETHRVRITNREACSFN